MDRGQHTSGQIAAVDEGKKQNVIRLSDNGAVLSQANVRARGYRDQTGTRWHTSQLNGSQSELSSTPTAFGMTRSRACVGDELVAFGAHELNQLTPTRRPLNTLGTQFIMPTQVDPSVLAELPVDMRSRLQQQIRQTSPSPAARSLHKDAITRTPSNYMPFAITALPAQSQLDLEILAALPPDVRDEIIAHYAAGAAAILEIGAGNISDRRGIFGTQSCGARKWAYSDRLSISDIFLEA